MNEWEYLLLDGFPRNLDQKDYFVKQWENKWRDYVCVNFDLSREKAIERIQKRAIEQGRADDANEDVINKRLETFYSETLPVIEAFENDGKLITINADQSIEAIQSELIAKLS